MQILASKMNILRVALLVLACCLSARMSHAGSNITTNGGAVLRWPSVPQVKFIINPDGVPGFSGEVDRLVVAGAIRDAFRAWTEVPGAAISFTDGGLTSQTLSDPSDQVSLVTFQDNTFSFGPGVLAVTATIAAPVAGNIGLPDGSTVHVDFAGQILDADILFNPQVPNGKFFSPVGTDGSIDLLAVATHEIGHLLGLDHTGIFSSIMNPYAESAGSGVSSRLIQSDDAITISALYPVQTFAPSTGIISGTVTTSTGTAVLSAHVVALSTPGGTPVASQLSGPVGTYHITGLPPGNYHILVEPLDGPIDLSNFSDYYRVGGMSTFTTTMFGGLASPTTVSVAAGQEVAATVSLPPNPQSKVNIEYNGIFSSSNCSGSGSVQFLPGSLYLPRGHSYCVMVTDTSDAKDTTMSFSSSDVMTLGSTVQLDFTNGPSARAQRITLGASAALGPSDFALTNSSSTSVKPGGVVVTVNPSLATPLREGAGFGTTLAPGGFISIFGTDLAKELVSASAIPLPTTLGGVSVKIGNRFAPLFFVSPGQINALIPFEVSGTVNVQVVTGPGAGGNTVAVNLSPTAPGLFSTNSSGSGQGAILNQDNVSFAAPTDSIPGAAAHPAKPGEVVVIFASGLGPVTPTLASGLDSGAGGTTYPQMVNYPTVRIGGQVAALDFAGLAPGYVGLYQVNAHVPAGVTPDDAVPVEITTFEGQTSNSVTIAVSQ